jgi:hypothetical protein
MNYTLAAGFIPPPLPVQSTSPETKADLFIDDDDDDFDLDFALSSPPPLEPFEVEENYLPLLAHQFCPKYRSKKNWKNIDEIVLRYIGDSLLGMFEYDIAPMTTVVLDGESLGYEYGKSRKHLRIFNPEGIEIALDEIVQLSQSEVKPGIELLTYSYAISILLPEHLLLSSNPVYQAKLDHLRQNECLKIIPRGQNYEEALLSELKMHPYSRLLSMKPLEKSLDGEDDKVLLAQNRCSFLFGYDKVNPSTWRFTLFNPNNYTEVKKQVRATIVSKSSELFSTISEEES